MKTSPRISIVTPSFNQGKFIADAIESVLSQDRADLEHIIVDNCSSDETSKVLARYPHLKVICAKDRGQSDALNNGFKAATGDIIGWLNADDKYLPGCLDAVVGSFFHHPEYDLVYGDYRFVDVNGDLIAVRKEIAFDLFLLKYLHWLTIPSTTTFFKRKIFDEGHFLDINYHYVMDYEFFMRIAGHRYKFGYIPRVMADFRRHAATKSRQTALGKAEMEKALLLHDPLISGLQAPWRGWVRNSLMLMARAKRTFLKLLRGAYFIQ